MKARANGTGKLNRKTSEGAKKSTSKPLSVLVVDIGGTHIKILASGEPEPRKFPSGPDMPPKEIIAGVKELAKDWKYDVVSIGYPGPVLHNKPRTDPFNLAPGWMKFDFEGAFKCPYKLINDASMQALGSYRGGKLLFLGLGTGLGSAMVVDGIVVPMELGHLPYRKGTYEDYAGLRGIEKRGKEKWEHHVKEIVAYLTAALLPEDVVLGGGNVKKLKELPPGCRVGDNANAFLGGFRLWEQPAYQTASLPQQQIPKLLNTEGIRKWRQM